MGSRYTDERADAIARAAEEMGSTQARRGRDAAIVAGDMHTLEAQFRGLSETERLLAESHMDQQYALVDKITKHSGYHRR